MRAALGPWEFDCSESGHVTQLLCAWARGLPCTHKMQQRTHAQYSIM